MRKMGTGASPLDTLRKPVPFRPDGAVMSVINQALGQDAVRIALAAYIEGRGLLGDWQLRVTGAELIPAKDSA